MMNQLTGRKKQIYEYIAAQVKAQGYPPSIREICAAVGLKSPSSVHTYLKELEHDGYIEGSSSKKRAIRLTAVSASPSEPDRSAPALSHAAAPPAGMPASSKRETASAAPPPTIQVPLLGRVTAGMPILAMEEVEDYISFFSPRMRGEDLFALRVSGESMKNAGILDEDIIVVEKTASARDGEIVVAMIDEEATVKRFFRHGDHVTLMPENPAYAPIECRDVLILGRVVANLRFYNGFSLY